jgi:single-strand selective monofunctional uracil DNA glycosylase
MDSTLGAPILKAAHALSRDVGRLSFSAPVACVYNPLEYARAPGDDYLGMYATCRKGVLFLGMNPGPWGMAQTGVPFGEVSVVRDWLGVRGKVGQPAAQHPRVPVRGFDCHRSEVSGRRLWGLLADHYRTAEDFRRHAFVSNYCPLLFLDAEGKNLTPDKIARPDREALAALCDRYLAVQVEVLQPRWLVGVGQYALKRLEALVPTLPGVTATVLSIPHPSPANPSANRDWAAQARARLEGEGIW